MNLNESMRILNITKNELPSLDEVKLRKIFHNKALTMHPDKGGDNNDFINLKKAHDNLKSVVNNKNNIIKHGTNNIDSFINIDLIKTYFDIFIDSINKVKKQNKTMTLTTNLEDILSNNVRQFNYENKTYFVPLWHEEVIFDLQQYDLIIYCQPILPNELYIDVDRNIHIKLDINYKDIINQKIYKFKIINKFEYEINIESLFIKEYQIYILKNKGISKININDIYDVEQKHDIIVHIYLH